MPKLGLTMEAGTITDWLVPDGAEVSENMAVLLIETDKVETEVEAGGAGILRQSGEVGETYSCGERLGWILEIGESFATPTSGGDRSADRTSTEIRDQPPQGEGTVGPDESGRSAPQRTMASPNARRVAVNLGVDLDGITGSGPNGRIISADVELAASSGPSVSAGAPGCGAWAGERTTSATSAARQLADQLGVRLSDISSTSVGPQITREDVLRHARDHLAGLVGRKTPAPALLQKPESVIPLAGMRRTIADRMLSSLREMAQLTLTMDVCVDGLMAHREQFSGTGQVPSYTDYVISAVSQALVQHPIVNSQLTDEELALLPEINIGLAVAVENGLVVPVVRGADRLSVTDLASETSRLASAARSGELGLSDVEGGTFSITALGMYGVDGFTPVINPPNTAVLGIGRIRDQAIWNEKGRIERARVLTLSLTWDHRAFDGVPAAEFVGTIRGRLESAQFDG